MPKGRKDGKRTANEINNAVNVIRVPTSAARENLVAPASAGATLGKLGGQARARNISPARRTEIAKKATAARWGK